jgi:flagellar hook assembly protein FlgD
MGVDDENSDYLPQEYTLEQNYPNPFNPATEIEYSIPMRSDVVISVFNVLGQHVRSLFEGKRAAGTYQVVWDGKGDDGLPVATGVYLYRLQVDNQIKAKKMLLLK